MSEHDARIRVERVDWAMVLPWLVLFRSARMALHPARLLLALLLVALLYLGGQAMDVVWGVPPQAVEQGLDRWADSELSGRAGLIERRRASSEMGIFQTVLLEERAGFLRLVRSAVRLDLGVGDFLAGRGLESGGAMGALGQMALTVPAWLYRSHPSFLLVYLVWAFFLTMVLGGAIARLAALHACLDRRGSILEALRFVGHRYPWFLVAPLIPVGLVLVIALLLMLVGLLFNLPGLDVIGALAYGLLLAGGVLAALLLVGLATGGHLLLPALAVEGTDAFDAISRAYNYVFGRPWRYLFYTAASLVYGAVVYLALGLLVFLALWLTWSFVGTWVFTEAGEAGRTRFETMVSEPSPAALLPEGRTDELGGVGTVASIIIRGWTHLLVALLPAFAFSFYLCMHTWIYLLLRRAADGTELDDLFIEARPESDGPPEKIEPADA